MASLNRDLPAAGRGQARHPRSAGVARQPSDAPGAEHLAGRLPHFVAEQHSDEIYGSVMVAPSEGQQAPAADKHGIA